MAGKTAKIRAVKIEDAPDINRMRTMDGVRENILGMMSERIADSEKYIRELTQNDHVLVAEENGAVIGCAGLHVSPRPRERHTAWCGINIHTEHQRQGVGKALMEAILDIADNWLKLKRVELCVFTDNQSAISLYKKMGFVVEGTKKFAAIRDGAYIDEYLMARYQE